MESIFRLTKKIYVEDFISTKTEEKFVDQKQIVRYFLQNGFMPDSNLLSFFEENSSLYKFVLGMIKKNSTSFLSWTKTFQSSWKRIQEASVEELVLQQILHYITTYGTDFTSNFVYIPNDKTVSFKIEDYLKAPIFVLSTISKEEVEKELITLVSSGIALSNETILDIKQASEKIGMSVLELLENSKNKEMNCRIYNELKIIPKDPVEFLRLIVFNATGNTLLIKSKKVIQQLDAYPVERADELLSRYEENYGLIPLAKIFYRFKPIFLALKSGYTATQINRIRTLAKKHHKPMEKDLMNSIVESLKNGKLFYENEELMQEVDSASVFRKARILKALYLNSFENRVYKIRNGKLWIQASETTEKQVLPFDQTRAIAEMMKSIAKNIEDKVKGKKVFIPEGVLYPIPSSEKTFKGGLPEGTRFDLNGCPLVGVHWYNLETKDLSDYDKSVDLDLSTIDLTGKKIGWDRFYRVDNTISFSGDLTDAPKPKGATEFIKINKDSEYLGLLLLNNYRRISVENGIPFSVLVGQSKEYVENRIFKPEYKVFDYSMAIGTKMETLGLLYVSKEEERNCFYIYNGSTISNRTAILGKNTQTQIIDLKNQISMLDKISLNKVFELAGAEFVETAEEAEINLSPNALNKTTIIELLV